MKRRVRRVSSLKPIDVTSYDDIMRAITDGRLAKITGEHPRYMKETGREIWAP